MAIPGFNLTLTVDVEDEPQHDDDFELFSQLTAEAEGLVDISHHDLLNIKEIGRGQQGVVYLRKHIPTGTNFAVKVVPANLEAEARKMLLREIRSLYRCNHPNIVSVHGAYFESGYVSIVLELLSGTTLSDLRKKRGNLAVNYLAAISKQLLQGLHHIHSLGMLHRDLKPSNVLLDPTRGLVKISDLGVAAELDGTMTHAQKTSCNTWVGSLNYMSPERLEGGKYKQAADVWALGVTIHELASGRLPIPESVSEKFSDDPFWDLVSFFSNNDGQVHASIMQQSPQLAAFLALMLKRSPEQRASTQELLQHPFIQLAEKVGFDEMRSFLTVLK